MVAIRNPFRALAAVLLLVVLAAAGCGGGAKTSSDGTAAAPSGKGEIGTQAPAFELADLTGQNVSSSAFAGKVVILDFWATWCPPCREEVPHFVQLQSKYRDQGLTVVGLSLDAGGAKDVAPFAEEYNVNYTMLIGADDVAKAFGGINSIPTTFVIDRQGKIVKRLVGFTPPEVFEATIAPLLAATS
ncbi:MAG: TlpA disulfide reductase family protein [Candidatus Eisenbacteria bacterium]